MPAEVAPWVVLLSVWARFFIAFLHIYVVLTHSFTLLIITILVLPILLWDKPLNTLWSTAHAAPKVFHTGSNKDTVILRFR